MGYPLRPVFFLILSPRVRDSVVSLLSLEGAFENTTTYLGDSYNFLSLLGRMRGFSSS